MKLFSCGACGNTLFFDNVSCRGCGRRLGFIPAELDLAAFDPAEDGTWRRAGAPAEGNARYAPCANGTEFAACNWVVPLPAGGAGHRPLCPACTLNRTIPDLRSERNQGLFRQLQAEKSRLIYSLLRLGLPVENKGTSPERGLAFDFLETPDPRFREDSSVISGHAAGLITLDIAEADDAVRERVRQEMAEPYRTLLGHFRHESGHYYWDRLVRDSGWIGPFRERFGDERADYGEALERHYAAGPPPAWPQQFISAYATAHPWEDWAESWAHYLHIVDTLETAAHFGLRPAGAAMSGDAAAGPAGILDPYATAEFEGLIGQWFPLSLALNSLNRSMGQPDAYPFVIAPPAVDKLRFVHRVIRGGAPPPPWR